MVSCKKILSPTDFSEPSYEVLKAANGMALQYSSKFFLAHVVPPIPSVIPVRSMPVQAVSDFQFNISRYEAELVSSAEKSI